MQTVAKQLIKEKEVTVGEWCLHFLIRVNNYGEETLLLLQ